MRNILKKLWKQSPAWSRVLFLRLLCRLRLSERREGKDAITGVPVYIFGCFQAGGGLSRSAELYAEQFEKTHRHCIRVDTTREALQTVKKPVTDGSVRFIADIIDDCGAGTVIIHHNPPQLQWLLCRLGRRFLRHKRIIAYMVWELEDIPPLWKHALRFVDAVETPSTFSHTAIARSTHKPVSVRPHCVSSPPEVRQGYCADGILRCLFIFDMASLCPRKYPEAAIKAFAGAFTPEEGRLSIKIGQHTCSAQDYERLLRMAGAYPHIQIITGWMDDAALHRLYLEHDVYLSLHRSEGYGLTIREAMLRRLYVVATAWSGNMDFMEGDLVYPVPYRLIPVDREYAVFNSVPRARWAEPDIEAAAAILRRLRTELLSSSGFDGNAENSEASPTGTEV